MKKILIGFIAISLLTFFGCKNDKVNTNTRLLTFLGFGVTDAKANTYTSVKIGNQEWMTENLNVDHFRDGDIIPEAKTSEEWKKAVEENRPAWCYYDNNPTNGEKYGKLYNWYAVNDQRGLAPEGWDLPTDAEWNVLTDYLRANGHNGTEGKALKANSGWDFGHYRSGTDNYGWSGLPGGICTSNGSFIGIGSQVSWWSSSKVKQGTAWYCNLKDRINYADSAKITNCGISVRCVRKEIREDFGMTDSVASKLKTKLSSKSKREVLPKADKWGIITPTFVINVAAVKTEKAAQEQVDGLKKQGYNSGFYWIPDYKSLSGSEYYAVYIGPIDSQKKCEEFIETYRVKNKSAYAVLLSQQNRRIEIRGLGKVKVIENYRIEDTDFAVVNKTVVSKDDQSYDQYYSSIQYKKKEITIQHQGHMSQIDKADYTDFNIPDNAIIAFEGFYAGVQNKYYVVKRGTNDYALLNKKVYEEGYEDDNYKEVWSSKPVKR